MRTIATLYLKEIRSLFNSWIAYVTMIAFTLLNGVNFYIAVETYDKLTRYSATLEEGAARRTWNIIDQLMVPLYQSIFVLLFVMVPAITMRLFAEEKKQRTEELLLTSPVHTAEIVIAKYLAAASLIALMLLPAAMYPALMFKYCRPLPDVGAMATGYAALFFIGFSLAAIGLFASSLTENQIVAFIISVALEMIFFLVAQATVSFDFVKIGHLAFNLGSFLRAFSLQEHFAPMVNGLMRLSDVVYFLTLTVFWLWATHKSVESARWAG